MNARPSSAARSQEGQGLANLLFAEVPTALDVPSFAWGFGGLHGGLALSLVASSVQQSVPGHSLRSISGQFLKPIRDTFAIESRVIRSGRSAAVVQATGSDSQGISLTATAILGVDQPGTAPRCAPKAPDVPGPQSVPPLAGVDVKVPVLSQVDVRPVGSISPYAGAAEIVPTMTAWMRLRDRDAPVDPCSIVFFLDALPPSYTAVLTERRPVPTLELSAHLTSSQPASPWVLIRSRTTRASEGGWVTELIDAWDPLGVHLGSAQQLRLASAPRA